MLKEILQKKRDGLELTRDELENFIAAVVEGGATDAQVAAFTMAVCCRGMSARECAELTSAMANSGKQCSWIGADRPIVDKHSTGGVGDKVSLILAPLLASCGLLVPMISGRGLGHTGGTLDKLEAIPGYQTQVSIQRLEQLVQKCSCAIVGASADLAPADRRMYELRDTTGSVESTALITASILSKKIAASLEHLVLDVKVGNGTFCRDLGAARELAQSLVNTAAIAGLRAQVVISDMNQVLGHTAGNALEVMEAIELLSAPEDADPRLKELCLHLGAISLRAAGVAADRDEARAQLNSALENGKAAECFARMVAELGGPHDLLEHPASYLSRAPMSAGFKASSSGYLELVNTYQVGLAIVELGGGRNKPEDKIDPRVGLEILRQPGELVEADESFLVVHARDQLSLERATRRLQRAYRVSPSAPATNPLIHEEINPDG